MVHDHTASNDDIRERARGVISRLFRIHIDQLDDGVLFREELGIDSLRGLEIIAVCETELGFTIDETGCVDALTIGDFLDFLHSAHGAQRTR
ncbi:MAG: acyl carrier protein [Spirochaetaceae bacterium]|nr:MAG: acyl carrier protein [Spirochaetaceae bacterium]